MSTQIPINAYADECMRVCVLGEGCIYIWMLFVCEDVMGRCVCVCLWLVELSFVCSCWRCCCAPSCSSRPKLCVGADPHCPDIIFVSFGVSAPGRHRPAAWWHSHCHCHSHSLAECHWTCAHFRWLSPSPFPPPHLASHCHWPAAYSRSLARSHDHWHGHWPWKWAFLLQSLEQVEAWTDRRGHWCSCNSR